MVLELVSLVIRQPSNNILFSHFPSWVVLKFLHNCLYNDTQMSSSKHESCRYLTTRPPIPFKPKMTDVETVAVRLASQNLRLLTLYLHGLQECFATYTVAVGIPAYSPLKPRLDVAISRIFESGLVWYWKQESQSIFKKVSTKYVYLNASYISDAMLVIVMALKLLNFLVKIMLHFTSQLGNV